MTLKEIENWCHRAFNYLNGFVNPTSKIGSLKITRFGTQMAYINASNPHVSYITINPRLIEQTFKPEHVPRVIIDILIHELTHAEQRPNWRNYARDSEYKDKIEEDARKKSYGFVQRNKEKLNKDFGLQVIEGPLTEECFKDAVWDEVIKDIKT